MADGDVIRIEEHMIEDKRLGRHVWHDPASRQFNALTLVPEEVEGQAAQQDRLWHRYYGPLNQGNLGSCFPAGTRVRMADGSERAIEDVRLLDEVVTAEGNLHQVTRMMVRQVDDGLMRIMLHGHNHLRCTREHPILTDRGYVEAGQLVIGDVVLMPKYLAVGATSIETEQFLTVPTHKLPRGFRRQGLPGRVGISTTANDLPAKIELTPEMGRLVGLFLAEGSVDKTKIRWCFGRHELDTLVAETVALIGTELGAEATVQHRAHNSEWVTLYGTGWARLFSGLCGDGAGRKRPHPLLMSGSPEFQEAMLRGWLAGDGHRRPNGAAEGVTISPELALAMYDIAQGLGWRPVIDHRESPQNRHAAHRQPRWTLTTAPTSATNYSTQDDLYVYRKVRELRFEDFAGPVYNLSVEGDESYVAEGIGVHNCTGNAGIGSLMTSPNHKASHRYSEKDAVKVYELATTLDDAPGQYPPDDTGSSGLAALKAMKQLGLIGGYRWTFAFADALTVLSTVGPIMVGVNWYDSFDKPDAHGVVSLPSGAQVRGGHEFEILGIMWSQQQLRAINSWGPQWGDRGYFTIPFAVFDRLLNEQGDVAMIDPTAKISV